MTPRKDGNRAVAAEAWRGLFDFIVATAEERQIVLERLGLTPNDSRALTSLEPDQPQAMRSLAHAWHCDASTATWIVDRLARRGLVRRREDTRDRRVTLVALTPKGVKTRADMLRGMYEPPPELLSLSARDLVAIREAVRKLPRRPAASTLADGAAS